MGHQRGTPGRSRGGSLAARDRARGRGRRPGRCPGRLEPLTSYEYLHVLRDEDVAIVRIDRPPANAMDTQLLEEGHRLADELVADPPAAVVLTGREGFFSAGADLKLAPTLDADGQRAMVEGINAIFAGWYGFPRPVVCAVNGHAIAGGFILALCGDYRVGSTEGKYGLTELKAGLPYPSVAMAVVRAELHGPGARRLVLGADLVGAKEAQEAGAFDEITAPDQVLHRATEVARGLAALPAEAYGKVKAQLRGPVLDAALAQDDPLLAGWAGAETAEAAAAILDRPA